MRLQTVIFFVLFSICSQISVAQNFNLGIRSVNIQNDAVNNCIDHYNEARPWLKNKLGRQNFLRGFTFKFESDHDLSTIQLMFYASWVQRKTHARGEAPNGQSFRRSVRSRFVDVGLFGAGYYPINEDNLKVGVAAFPLNVTWYSIFSKINTDDEGWVRYSIPDPFSLDDGFFGKINTTGRFEVNAKYRVENIGWFTLSLYLQKRYFGPNYNVEYLNQTINPDTYQWKVYDKRLNPSNWGFTIYFSPETE